MISPIFIFCDYTDFLGMISPIFVVRRLIGAELIGEIKH
jgi:hypothetical protein